MPFYCFVFHRSFAERVHLILLNCIKRYVLPQCRTYSYKQSFSVFISNIIIVISTITLITTILLSFFMKIIITKIIIM